LVAHLLEKALPVRYAYISPLFQTIKLKFFQQPKTPKTENVLKPKPASNSLFPPVHVPKTAAERRKLLTQLTNEKNKEMAKLMELCASETKHQQH
jgi:hypothetical protein